MIGAFRPDGEAPRYFGLFPAIVTDIVDPENLGRIEVKLPWLGGDGDAVRAWATLLTPYADDDQGFEFLPAVETQVVIAFEAGELRRPYIVGFMLERARSPARSARHAQQQTADQNALGQHARIRRHRGRGQSDGLDAQRSPAGSGRRGAGSEAAALQRLRDHF